MAKVKLVKSTCHLSNLWQEINTNSVTGQVNVNHASNLVKSPDKCFFGWKLLLLYLKPQKTSVSSKQYIFMGVIL